jgi:hypothetical protein
MQKNISYQPRLISICVLMCALVLSGVASAQREVGARQPAAQKRLPRIVPSSLLSLLERRIKEQPGLSPQELAAYANSILAHEGFNYKFDLCEIARKGEPDASKPGASQPKTFLLPMTSVEGEKLTFRITGENPEGLCGQCYFSIPCLNVTGRDMLMVSKGRQYRLKRSEQMYLDEMSLVDETMNRALRTWQVPYETSPLGISPDGRKLYLDLTYDAEDKGLAKLVLEISETGLRVAAREELNLKEGELIEEHPTDPKNSYLSFMRFRVGDQSYIIRFSAPCT